jgi:iron complex transport system substrate-binding protein
MGPSVSEITNQRVLFLKLNWLKMSKRVKDRFLRVSLFALLALTCNHCGPLQTKNIPDSGTAMVSDTSIQFAKRFAISIGTDYKIIHLFGQADTKDTTANFIVYNNLRPAIELPNSYFIKAPCKQIISLSSIYSNMLAELNGAGNIIAIENADYYTNATILKMVKSGSIKQVQRNPEIDRELVLKLKPDVIFAFGMGKTSGEFDSKLLESGIPVVISLDHLETSPLARAEWIKFFAVFVNKETEANRIFDAVVSDYTNLKDFAIKFKDKPSVFSELKFGDTWYVPGGKSFMAQLIADANAVYLWQNDTLTGSLPLSFETVYKKAHEADFWLNVSMCTNKKQMLEQDKRYGDFLAFKNNAVYNNNLNCNQFSYSSYWETGMIYPNRILSDMIQLFHKGAGDSLKKEMYYYKQLN